MRNKNESFLVWEENWESFLIFSKMATQWVISGIGTITGLNYQSLEFILKLYKPRNRKKIFEDIQEIERGALEVYSRQAKERMNGGT